MKMNAAITFSKSTRCQCKNKNGRTCNNRHFTLYKYQNKNICLFHYNSQITKFVIVIQAFYKSYKQRRLIKNVYAKLPDDIQYKILRSVRQEYYYKKRLKTIENIMINKLKKFSCDIFPAYDEDQFVHFKYFEYVVKNRDYIIHMYKLYAKYSQLLSKNFSSHSHNLTDNLILMNFKIVDYKYKVYNAYTNHIYEVTCATYFILEKILFDGGFMSQS
jgi:hypothetical protein